MVVVQLRKSDVCSSTHIPLEGVSEMEPLSDGSMLDLQIYVLQGYVLQGYVASSTHAHGSGMQTRWEQKKQG